MKPIALFLVFTLTIVVIVSANIVVSSATAQTATAQVFLLDKNDAQRADLTDGNLVRLQIILPQAVETSTPVNFHLKGLDTVLASCTINRQEKACKTELFPSLGWHWNPGGEAQPERIIQASLDADTTVESSPILVNPRPVVMVHGFSSSWEAWTNYLGSTGYLAQIGVPGYAVGDGQVAGVLNTGNLSAPTQRTNTIAQNAAILGEYIQNVQEVTGAEKVDLVVHSMGGMISRYYIDRLMKNAQVAQLIILGTPMAGTACANLPASLGFYIPATIEIQPSYMTNIFNPQITHRRGVPFHAIAGTQILDAIQSPCTSVPSDIVVSLESMHAIPLEIVQIPLLHIDLNLSGDVFESFVKPLVQTPPGAFPADEDNPSTVGAGPSLQFTGTYHGHLQPGETKSITIAIDPNVTVASFGLYDTSRSLAVSVQGASGKTIDLSVENNGLLMIDNPETLVFLGYGFKNPKAGAWVVTLNTTERTPATGADYALSARFEGGAKLEASANPLLPHTGERVTIQASLNADTTDLPISGATAIIYAPDGKMNEITLNVSGNQAKAEYIPQMDGVHGIEIHITATTSDNFVIDRATWLAFEVQPSNLQTWVTRSLFISLCCCSLVILILVAAWLLKRKRR